MSIYIYIYVYVYVYMYMHVCIYVCMYASYQVYESFVNLLFMTSASIVGEKRRLPTPRSGRRRPEKAMQTEFGIRLRA